MAGTLTTIFVLILAIAVGIYQFYVSPLLARHGYGRIVEPVGNSDCSTVPELKACESMLHASS